VAVILHFIWHTISQRPSSTTAAIAIAASVATEQDIYALPTNSATHSSSQDYLEKIISPCFYTRLGHCFGKCPNTP
jgi:hypothetical protein